MDINHSIGWINKEGIDLHLQYMKNEYGKILEGGSAAGKLFYHLHQIKPKWEYYAVNTWTDDEVYLQKNWSANYFDKDNLGEQVTVELFTKHCPFAEYYDIKFEDFESNEKFDIISIGQIGCDVDWVKTFEKAYTYLNVGGVIVGRNYNHYKYGNEIQQAIAQFDVVEIDNQSDIYPNQNFIIMKYCV